MTGQSLPGLYIHVPFCRTKCPYCDFYSCTELPFVLDFTAALNQELLLYCKSFPAVDSLYFGGAHQALSAAPMRIAFGHIPDIEVEAD